MSTSGADDADMVYEVFLTNDSLQGPFADEVLQFQRDLLDEAAKKSAATARFTGESIVPAPGYDGYSILKRRYNVSRE